jgi:hypothetical protein
MHQRTRFDQASADTLSHWVGLIRAEYTEMPGLHLSKRQAQRLWNMSARTCDVIFEALEASQFLRRLPNDSYVRAHLDH